jgi:AbrB family looped-hinge helix DNA binding protein
MASATMTSKGQITLPAATRARLRLVKGSKLDVSENDKGQIVLTPRPAKTGDIRKLRGILKYDGPPVSIEEMNEAILKAASRRFRDSVE